MLAAAARFQTLVPDAVLVGRIGRLLRAFPMYGTTRSWLGWIESRRARAASRDDGERGSSGGS